jgi:hypothetical protein
MQAGFTRALATADEVYLGAVSRAEKLKEEERFDAEAVRQHLTSSGRAGPVVPEQWGSPGEAFGRHAAGEGSAAGCGILQQRQFRRDHRALRRGARALDPAKLFVVVYANGHRDRHALGRVGRIALMETAVIFIAVHRVIEGVNQSSRGNQHESDQNDEE